ncbi:MAG: hypothetical protein ACR2KC_06475 [Acidimicrobiales bacterium]
MSTTNNAGPGRGARCGPDADAELPEVPEPDAQTDTCGRPQGRFRRILRIAAAGALAVIGLKLEGDPDVDEDSAEGGIPVSAVDQVTPGPVV